jgi:8-amino-7-oxononanoate synthase
MDDAIFADLAAELAQAAQSGLQRRRRLLQSAQGPHVEVDGRRLLSFCSNDYLGLANHPQLIAALQQGAALTGVGSGASHLVTGHHRLHERLEQALAAFSGLPAALLFSSGYMANLGVVTALLGRNDAIFADRLNHASLNDAALLCRAEFKRYAHNHLAALESLLQASRARRKLVAVDAVFSMDGDLAPVPELLALCERYDAWLLLDDAHGFGVLGEQGRGILSHYALASPRIIYMATLGKAAGVFGAFVAGEPVLIDYLLQKARSYIYTTAMPPALAAAVLAALDVIAAADGQRLQLQRLRELLSTQLQLCRWQLMPSPTAIQPLIVGSNEEALKLSEYLLAADVLVPAIRPPTVPQGTARLRISLSAAHTEADVARLVAVLNRAEEAWA